MSSTPRGRMAQTADRLPAHAEVVVVGSGYGGAIAASRLARAGRDVCLLERGREFLAGDLPNIGDAVAAETRLETPLGGLTVGAWAGGGAHDGLYQLRIDTRMSVFTGCGLGGTSLINANVVLRPDPRVMEDPRWPVPIRTDGLFEAGMVAAERMLGATPYPADRADPPKLAALRTGAARLGWPTHRVPLAVTFADGTNAAGLTQRACTDCGDCMTGCNASAKNTLDQNYLPDAYHHGANLFTGVEVRRVSRSGARWLVYFRPAGAADREAFEHAPDLFMTADVVVLAGGVLGSVEILLRSRAAGLPLSDQVGRHFSTNRNALAFGIDLGQEVRGVGFGDAPPDTRAPVGPLITGAVDLRGTPDVDDGLIIEEGVVPGAFGGGILADVAAAVTPPDRTLTLLTMGHDRSPGRFTLERDLFGREHLRVDWPADAAPHAAAANDAMAKLVGALEGIFVPNPAFAALPWHPLIAVQPLGGCVVADDATQGGVDERGRLFDADAGTSVHAGLYVMDGSIVPRSTGLNPLLTISALAERAVRLLAADRGWTIDDAARAPARAPAAAPVSGEHLHLRETAWDADGTHLGPAELWARLGPVTATGGRSAVGALRLSGPGERVLRVCGEVHLTDAGRLFDTLTEAGERRRIALDAPNPTPSPIP